MTDKWTLKTPEDAKLFHEIIDKGELTPHGAMMDMAKNLAKKD